MTLSALIPIYNYNALQLVQDLLELIQREHIDAEIILADDASSEHTEWFTNVRELPRLTLWQAPHNLGRAAIRNKLASLAQGQWLWFVDCDTALTATFSFKAFLEAAKDADVVCGGTTVPEEQPKGASLRYKYEYTSSRTAIHDRSQTPFHQLTTCNMFIRRSVFTSIQLCEEIKEYGYEDALFGAELERHQVSITHIQNPVIHLGLEPNNIFLDKTETALRTLYSLGNRMQGYSRVQDTAKRLQRYGLSGFVRRCFSFIRKPLRKHLEGPNPNLTAFAFYKLGYYLTLN